MLFSGSMNRHIYLLRPGDPFGINLCGGLGIVASDRVEVVINRLVCLVRQYVQTAGERVAQEGLFEPMNSQTPDGVRVHERFVR